MTQPRTECKESRDCLRGKVTIDRRHTHLSDMHVYLSENPLTVRPAISQHIKGHIAYSTVNNQGGCLYHPSYTKTVTAFRGYKAKTMPPESLKSPENH